MHSGRGQSASAHPRGRDAARDVLSSSADAASATTANEATPANAAATTATAAAAASEPQVPKETVRVRVAHRSAVKEPKEDVHAEAGWMATPPRDVSAVATRGMKRLRRTRRVAHPLPSPATRRRR